MGRDRDVQTTAYRSLDRLLLPAFWVLNRRPRIFLFHSVSSVPVISNTGELGPRARPDIFEAFIDWLAEQATIVTVSELVRVEGRRRALSDRMVAISLDDGYEDNYSVAYPILKRRSLPATIFLTGAMIRERDDDPGPGLCQAQVREMHAAGIEFGAHSMSHPRLTALESGQAQYEIRQSKLAVESITLARCEGFCYPYGAVDSKVRDLVRQCGYRYAVTTQDRLFGRRDRFLLPRTVLPPHPDRTDFAVRLSGAHAWRQSVHRPVNQVRRMAAGLRSRS